MNLRGYFEHADGLGILSTADKLGNVDAALYAVPHVISEDTIAFIMRPRLSFHNIQQNPRAVYLFLEKGPDYKGRRLYLEMLHMETDPEKAALFRQKSRHNGHDEADSKLVYFKVVLTRPLTGDREVY
ncbi:MAG: hypothetical protein L0Y36_10570 [Planctomycetales bacterium]|nr:hypothetical protein [Planctomycetales bacterium]